MHKHVLHAKKGRNIVKFAKYFQNLRFTFDVECCCRVKIKYLMKITKQHIRDNKYILSKEEEWEQKSLERKIVRNI